MADQHSVGDMSQKEVLAESSDSTVELNIKTLDSKIYTFHVDKNMPVSVFKETISGKVGLPVGQQRLIFRGRLLKDYHLLSEHYVDNGDTLHLVAMESHQAQPDASTTAGPFAAADHGDDSASRLRRLAEAALYFIGAGCQADLRGGLQPNIQANQNEGSQVNSGSQSQTGNQPHPRPSIPRQSRPRAFPFPVGGAAVPTMSTPIPDSLHTLSQFMNRMEKALTQIEADQSNQPSNSTESLPPLDFPSNAHGVPTPAALVAVLRHAKRLLSGPTISSLTHIVRRLVEEEVSYDLTARAQIQTEVMQAALGMQHLGSALLELGRTMLTLRIGESPCDSYVNAGPAVYISPSGPNPLMVQAFPLQTSSLFGDHAPPPLNSGTFVPVGVASVSRTAGIRMFGPGPRTTNGGSNQGQQVNGNGRSSQMGNATAAADPLQTANASVSDDLNSSLDGNQPMGSDVVNEASNNLPRSQGVDGEESQTRRSFSALAEIDIQDLFMRVLRSPALDSFFSDIAQRGGMNTRALRSIFASLGRQPFVRGIVLELAQLDGEERVRLLQNLCGYECSAVTRFVEQYLPSVAESLGWDNSVVPRQQSLPEDPSERFNGLHSQGSPQDVVQQSENQDSSVEAAARRSNATGDLADESSSEEDRIGDYIQLMLLLDAVRRG